MKLSVVVASYNRPVLLRRLLLQLAAQELQEPFEVVVVDDGSQVPVADALHDLKTPFSLRILRQRNAGAAAARDAGVRAATGDVVLITDDDMQVGREFLRKHLEAHAQGRAVVLGRIKADPGLERMPLFERWHAAMLDQKAEGMAAGTLPLLGNLLFTGNVSLRRADYLAVGGFDPSLRQSEDIDLGLRLEELGVPFRFVDGAWTLHGSDRTSLGAFRARAWRFGGCDRAIARRHPHLRHASPWRFLFELNALARPFLVSALVAPRIAGLGAAAIYRVAQLAGAAGAERAAVAGTTLVYMIDYFRGLRDAAGRHYANELVAYAARFEDGRIGAACRKLLRAQPVPPAEAPRKSAA